MRTSNTATCQVCKKSFDKHLLIPAESLKTGYLDILQSQHTTWDTAGYICSHDLAAVRLQHVAEILRDDGAMSEAEKQVIQSIQDEDIISTFSDAEYEKSLPPLDRLSDKIASFGGSWTFIVSFFVVLIVWMIINSITLISATPFDPYPFILLNLVLSCIAAIQAPIILMSQKRAESRDRARAENDYKTNLKAEIEIRNLHEKLDNFTRTRWNTMVEMQEVQMEMLQEILEKTKK